VQGCEQQKQQQRQFAFVYYNMVVIKCLEAVQRLTLYCTQHPHQAPTAAKQLHTFITSTA
jgi:hypothetical protein